MLSIREDNVRQMMYRWGCVLWKHGMQVDEVEEALVAWARWNAPDHWSQDDHSPEVPLWSLARDIARAAARNSERILDENGEIGPPSAPGEEGWIHRDLDEQAERYGRSTGWRS